MAQKFLKQVSGNLVEQEALTSSAGAADAGKIVATGPDGRLAETVMPAGVGADVQVILASENLSAGDFVNIYDNAGTVNCRKADASTNKQADGFVKSAVNSGENATVYFDGANSNVTGLTVGAPAFLSGATPGAVISAAPTTAGHISQKLGKALTATSMTVEISEYPITLA